MVRAYRTRHLLSRRSSWRVRRCNRIPPSMKTTANTRQKLISNPEFAINYCKLCLLINVGRVNTTLAFYPQMKTALRTYHPVPSLQTEEVSRREMSDAPRIKAMLKMAFLDWEVNNAPTTLKAVAEKANDPHLTRGPPTTIIEAIFLVFQETGVSSILPFPVCTQLVTDLSWYPCSGSVRSISQKVSTSGTFSFLPSEPSLSSLTRDSTDSPPPLAVCPPNLAPEHSSP